MSTADVTMRIVFRVPVLRFVWSLGCVSVLLGLVCVNPVFGLATTNGGEIATDPFQQLKITFVTGNEMKVCALCVHCV